MTDAASQMRAQLEADINYIRNDSRTTVINYPDDSKYEGMIAEGAPHGLGVLWNSQGGGQIGMFAQGIANGQGRLFDSDGITRMKGNYSNGFLEGPAEEYSTDGSRFVGYYKSGVRNGEGKEEFVNGNIFRGNYINGSRDGDGVFILPDGSSFEGKFTKGNAIKGVEISPDGSSRTPVKFVNGRPQSTISSSSGGSCYFTDSRGKQCTRPTFRGTPGCYAHQHYANEASIVKVDSDNVPLPAATAACQESELNLVCEAISEGIIENHRAFRASKGKAIATGALAIGAGLIAGKILSDIFDPKQGYR